jgi:MFS superfamily sulfate permease-like transporter
MNQQQWIPLERSTATNVRHIATISAVLHLAVVLVFTLVGLVVGQLLIGIAVGVAVGAFLVRSIRRGAEQKILETLGGVAASETDHARLFNVVDGRSRRKPTSRTAGC